MGILEDLLASHVDPKAFSTGLASGIAISWQRDETRRTALVHDYLYRSHDYKTHGIDLDNWEPVIRRREDLSGIRERINEAGWIRGERRSSGRARNGSATYERLRSAGWV